MGWPLVDNEMIGWIYYPTNDKKCSNLESARLILA